MKHIDLEMYRWRFYNDTYIHTTKNMRPDINPVYSWLGYWKEYGAFVSVLPRQSGKSKMIYNLANYITNSKKRGLDNSQIQENLKKSRWSSEQIRYALRKYSGKRTGMYEIPLRRIEKKDSRKPAEYGYGRYSPWAAESEVEVPEMQKGVPLSYRKGHGG